MRASVAWCSLNHSACEPDETWHCHFGTCPHHSLIFHTCLILFRVTGSAAPGRMLKPGHGRHTEGGQRLKIWFIYRKSYSFEFNIDMNGLTLCLLRYSTIITCFSLWDSQNTILFFIIDRNTWECLGTLHGMCLHVWFLRLRQNNNTSSVIQGNAEVWVKAVDFRIGDSAGKEGKRNSHVWKKKDFGNTLESTYFAPNGALRNWVKINI